MDIQVDVILPVYKPTEELIRLIAMLEKQTVPVNRIIIMNTEEKYFNRLKYEKKWNSIPNNVEIHHISRREFDHGNTRNKAVKRSKAPYFICMTQDAMPEDETLVEKLIKPVVEHRAQVSYARQLPKKDTNPIEEYTRRFNYPDKSVIKSKADLEYLGIKTYFCSNVCAAYNRSHFDALGGFTKRTIFNEDMIFAANIIKTGGKIAYVAEARVFHSHNYSGKEYFKRNFDMGVSQADHPEIFGAVHSENEGISLVRKNADYLKREGMGYLVPKLIWYSACKYLGYRLGKKYRLLPERIIRLCTMNLHYWHG